MPWRRAWRPTPASCLENPMDRGAWWATVHGVTESWTRLERLSTSIVFPVTHGMWKLDHEEGWAPENWCFQTVMLQKTPEGPLDCKEIQPVNPRGNQPWIFIGRTVAEAEALILWPPDVKRQLTGKDPDAGKDKRQKEKGWQRMRRLDSITESVDVNLSKLCEIVENRGPRCTAVHGVAKSRTQLSD